MEQPLPHAPTSADAAVPTSLPSANINPWKPGAQTNLSSEIAYHSNTKVINMDGVPTPKPVIQPHACLLLLLKTFLVQA